MKNWIALLTMTLVLAACGKDGNNNPLDNVNEAAKDKDLQGKTFQSSCSATPISAIATGVLTGFSDAQKSSSTEYRFDGANVTRKTIIYTNTNCTEEAFSFEERGEFNINENDKKPDGIKSINMKFNALYVLIKNDAGVAIANATRLCGNTAWTKDSETEVTAASADLLCYNAAVPRMDANIYKVEGESLHLGDDSKAESTDQERPDSLDMGVTYVNSGK